MGSKACLSHDSGFRRAESFLEVSGPGPGSQGAEQIRHSGPAGRRNRSQGRARFTKKRCRSGGGVPQTAGRTFAKAEACDKYGPWRSVSGWACPEGGVPAGQGAGFSWGHRQATWQRKQDGSVGGQQPRQVVFQISVLERLSIPETVAARPGCHHPGSLRAPAVEASFTRPPVAGTCQPSRGLALASGVKAPARLLPLSAEALGPR